MSRSVTAAATRDEAGARPEAEPGATGPAARLVVVLITGYRRFVSPFLAPRCRFAPSCSAYAVGAISRHGLLRGGWLALRRLARCHPFHPGGVDPVPDRRPTSHPGDRTRGTGRIGTNGMKPC